MSLSLPIFVEIVTPDGDVKSRQKIDRLPARIGRAYDNDIILDDPHTAAHHAQLEQNQLDELIITDLDSLNGISLDHQRAGFFVVDSAHSYRLGRTSLRVRSHDYEVAPEVVDLTNHHWEGWLPALAGSALLIVTGLLSTWLADLNESNLSKYLLDLISLLGLAIGWSGIWAIFSKLFTGHSRFGRHLFIISCGAAVLELWDHLSSMLAYALSWESLAKFNNHPVIYLCAVILYFHLVTSGNKRPGRLKIYLAVLAVFISAITMTKHYQASSHLSDELYMGVIYPPVLRLSSDQSLTEFTTELGKLKAKVDQSRKDTADKNAIKDAKTKALKDSEDQTTPTSSQQTSSADADADADKVLP